MKKVSFKYFPNLYEDDALTHAKGVCQCCGKTVNEYIETMYTKEDVDCICLQCVSDGSAAAKFQGKFIDDADIDKSMRSNELNLKMKSVWILTW